MRKEYWAAKTYIGVMTTCTAAWGFLCVYVFFEGQRDIETYTVTSVMAIVLAYMCLIIYQLVKYPHVKLQDGKVIGPPSIIFSNKTINLDKPFHVNENRGNISVQQGRQYVGIIFRVLPEEQHMELRRFLITHEFNM